MRGLQTKKINRDEIRKGEKGEGTREEGKRVGREREIDEKEEKRAKGWVGRGKGGSERAASNARMKGRAQDERRTSATKGGSKGMGAKLSHRVQTIGRSPYEISARLLGTRLRVSIPYLFPTVFARLPTCAPDFHEIPAMTSTVARRMSCKRPSRGTSSRLFTEITGRMFGTFFVLFS